MTGSSQDQSVPVLLENIYLFWWKKLNGSNITIPMIHTQFGPISKIKAAIFGFI